MPPTNLFGLGYGVGPAGYGYPSVGRWSPLSLVEYAVTPMSAFIAATYNSGTLALTEDAGNNFHLAYPATATVPATRPAFVVEAKPNGRSWIQLRGGGYVGFDVTNGVAGVATNCTCYGIRALSGGWYELSMCPNVGVSEFSILLEDADDNIIYVGDGASGVFLRNYRIADFRDGKVPAHTLQAAPFTYERLPYPKFRGGVALGDSFTFNPAYTNRVNNTSTNLLQVPKGVGGEVLADIVARFTTDATPYGPSYVLLMGGINTINAAGADPNASMQASIATFVGNCAAIGALPVFCKIPPDKNYGSWSADRQTWADTYNTWLASYAAARGYVVIDLPAILATGDGQTLDAGFDSGDGLHPNTAGYNAIGDAIVTALDSATVPP